MGIRILVSLGAIILPRQCVNVYTYLYDNYISYFSVVMTQILDRNTFREEGCILAHGFKGFSPWLLGSECLNRTSWQQESVAEEAVHGG